MDQPASDRNPKGKSRRLPRLTREQLDDLESLNPRSPVEIRQEIEEKRNHLQVKATDGKSADIFKRRQGIGKHVVAHHMLGFGR